MNSSSFKFSNEQRRTLAALMKLLPADLVQSFLNRCEHTITEWQAEWSVEKMAGNRGASDNLRALSDALLQARCEIKKLPEGASCALWMSLHKEQTGKNTVKPWAAQDAYLLQLLALEQVAGTLAGDFSAAGGVVKYCERDLVDRLVQAFLDSSFDRAPSDAPNGIFMHVLDELAKNIILTLPGGGLLTMGFKIVRDSIAWHKQREAQFAQYQAGMYEFPEK